MPLHHSPSKQFPNMDHANTTGNDVRNLDLSAPVTLDAISKLISMSTMEVKAQIEDMRNSTNQNFQTMMGRMGELEKAIVESNFKIHLLENDVSGIRREIDDVKSSVITSLTDLEEKMREEQLKIMKQCNLIFMGIPEDNSATDTVEKILTILLPGSKRIIADNRLGHPDTSKKPRPMRVTMSSLDERRLALRNCKKLKDHPEYKKISVKPDLTRRQIAVQQAQKKNQPSTSHGSKRKLTDNSAAKSTKKQCTVPDEVEMDGTQNSQ
jgi:hypothetical protein